VRDSGSPNAVAASENATPCLASFDAALSGIPVKVKHFPLPVGRLVGREGTTAEGSANTLVRVPTLRVSTARS
jgi:hypothetical protein